MRLAFLPLAMTPVNVSWSVSSVPSRGGACRAASAEVVDGGCSEKGGDKYPLSPVSRQTHIPYNRNKSYSTVLWWVDPSSSSSACFFFLRSATLGPSGHRRAAETAFAPPPLLQPHLHNDFFPFWPSPLPPSPRSDPLMRGCGAAAAAAAEDMERRFA